MKKIQSVWVVDQLLDKGKISRNEALRHNVYRLGAIINELIKLGWKFDDTPSNVETMRGKFVKTNYGMDYVYYLVSKPKKIKRI